jgi:hypothetical protein
MINEHATTAEARRYFYAGRLPLFDRIAVGFLKAVASRRTGGLGTALNYLDEAVMIDGAIYPRRAVLFAMEDFGRQVEAPSPLQEEARAQMQLLGLNPVPDLRLYSNIATAILRIDAALRLNARAIIRTTYSHEQKLH